MKKKTIIRRLIFISVPLIFLLAYIIYRIPTKLEGVFTVYNEEGEAFDADASLRWRHYLMSPDVINGTVTFQGETYESMDLFSKRVSDSQPDGNTDFFDFFAGIWNNVKEKWSGEIIFDFLTTAKDFNQYFYGEHKRMRIISPQNIREGRMEFFVGVHPAFDLSNPQQYTESVFYTTEKPLITEIPIGDITLLWPSLYDGSVSDTVNDNDANNSIARLCSDLDTFIDLCPDAGFAYGKDTPSYTSE